MANIIIAERRTRIDFLKLFFREWTLLENPLGLNQALPMSSPAKLAIEKPTASNMAINNIRGTTKEKSLKRTRATNIPKDRYFIKSTKRAILRIPGRKRPIMHSYRMLVLTRNMIL